MRTKVLIVFIVVFSLLNSDCAGKPELPIDLVLELPRAKSSFPVSEDLLPYHWKKNPGRLAALPTERKWENTQITFNTDKEIFLNHSIDSIFFPKRQSYLFSIPKGKYHFKALFGLLGDKPNQFNIEGKFKILSNGKLVWSWDGNGKQAETWKLEETVLEVDGDLELNWESLSTHLFLGEPILTPVDLKNSRSLSFKKPKQFSVILIVIDSARRDFFGSYGYPYSVTPNLDEMARESVFFELPFANGNWTKPSMMSFFHSEYSSNLGLGNSWFSTKPYQRKVYYGKKRDNLAKTFREQGYYTKSIMNNVFFLDYTTVGLDLGFHNLFQVGKDVEDTPILTDHAVSFVEENKDSPYFLHFNLNTPHASYSPPKEDMDVVQKIVPSSVFNAYESPIKRYLGELHYTDREIGRLIQKLKDLGTYEETLIIVTGDHGELFSPHHDYSYHFIMKTRFGHGETHYDEEISVPYFIKLPNSLKRRSKFPPGTQFKIQGQSSLLSLAPTLLGLLDIKIQNSTYKGTDYSPCIRDAKECPKENFIYTEGRMSESVRTENYKYIRRYPGFTTVQRTSEGEPHSMAEELYDLKKDPEERLNLSILPEGEKLFAQARADFRRENFLKRNSLRILIPKCESKSCRDSLNLQIQGSVYDWDVPEPLSIVSSSAKTASISADWNLIGTSTKPIQFFIQTVNPEFGVGLQYYRNGLSVPVRLGKFGLESNLIRNRIEDFILSPRKPDDWESSPIPWIYNDGAFSGTVESEYQKEMGKEVKKILETWGYIHE